jgi:hypothetical protein
MPDKKAAELCGKRNSALQQGLVTLTEPYETEDTAMLAAAALALE